MRKNALHNLTSAEFVASLGATSSPVGLRRALQKNETVQVLKTAIWQGEVSEKAMQAFAEMLTAKFKPGKYFTYETALAAIAVAIESRKTDFTEHYLLDLARIDIEEMPMAPRVAQLCYKHWQTLPRTKEKSAPASPTSIQATWRYLFWTTTVISNAVDRKNAPKKVREYSDAEA